jgi:SnoaL-like domain
MSGEANRATIEGLFGGGQLALDAQAEYELRTEDYEMVMPQSGEIIRGRDKMRAMQERFPNPPQGVLKRLTGEGDLWVVEGQNDYGEGDVWHMVDIMEFEDGRIRRETRYYSKAFDAPEWRADLVDRL